MTTIQRNMILMITYLGLISCKPDEKQITYKNLLKICEKSKAENLINKKVFLVTGLDGCNSCLESTVKFIEKNINNDKIVFIISGKSKVKLKTTFNNKTIKRTNFILDTSLSAMRYNLVDGAFPKVYLCENGNIVESFEVNYITADEKFSYIKKFMRANEE